MVNLSEIIVNYILLLKYSLEKILYITLYVINKPNNSASNFI